MHAVLMIGLPPPMTFETAEQRRADPQLALQAYSKQFPLLHAKTRF